MNAEAQAAEAGTSTRKNQRTVVGRVVSDKANKTIVVTVERRGAPSASELETSQCLAWDEKLVRMERAEDTRASIPGFLPEDCDTSVGTGGDNETELISCLANFDEGAPTPCSWFTTPTEPQR